MSTAASSEARWLSRCMGVSSLLILILVTAATLNVATTCSMPLDSPGGSASMTKSVSVTQRISRALKRIGSRRTGAAGSTTSSGAAGLASGEGQHEVALPATAVKTAADVVVHVEAARELLALLNTPSGAAALGPTATIARALANAVIQVGGTLVEAAAKIKVGSSGKLPLNSWDSRELYTQQSCHAGADESEVCYYSGVLCYDGEGPVAIVAEPDFAAERPADPTHTCIDTRFNEQSVYEFSQCVINAASARKVNNTAIGYNVAQALPVVNRRWGPLNRGTGGLFKEMHPSEIWGDRPDALLAALGAHTVIPDPEPKGTPRDGSALDELQIVGDGRGVVNIEVPKDHKLSVLAGKDVATRVFESKPHMIGGDNGVKALASTKVAGRNVVWLESGLWISNFDEGDDKSPLKILSLAGSIFDSVRNNRTPSFGDHPRDGYMHFQESWQVASTRSVYMDPPSKNQISYKVVGQWDVPPMVNVAFAGAGAKKIESIDALDNVFSEMLKIAAHADTKFWFSDLSKTLGPDSLVCSRRGGVLQPKHKFFSGRMDSAMWKTYAYQLTGLGVKGTRPHPRYAPREAVILVDSSVLDDGNHLASEKIYNLEEVEAIVRSTGLPTRIIQNLKGMSFEEIVTLFAGVGILVAPHGPALAFTTFMPAHSVIVECFPFGLKRNTFRHLANMADLHYFSIYSEQRMTPADCKGKECLVFKRKFWDECESKNMTGYDVAVDNDCLHAIVNHPLIVDVVELRTHIPDAIDCSGAFSLKNPLWEALAGKEGKPVRPPPNNTNGDK